MSDPERATGRRSLEEMSVTEQVALLNSVLEGSTEYSIIAKDLDGTILAWNEGAHRVYGYTAADVVGKASAFILHHPDDIRSGKARAILDEAVRTGKWEGELRRVRKSGEGFRAHVTMTLRRDSAGKPIGFTMISRDLTESDRIERELRESQEYNRGLIESNIDALMTTDPLGIITDVNRQMCEMTGVGREELIGTPFKRYFTDPKAAEDGIRKVLAEDRVTNYELTMRSRTGKQTVVSYNATTFKGADGRLRGVFAAARDITDQKRLEEALRQTQNYTRGLIEASVDALVTVDPELRVTDVNEQTVRITGYTREELIGSPFPDYFTDPERATAGVQRTLAEGFVTNYVLVLRSKSGQETPVSFNASVFRDTEGSVRGIFAAARDITEQKRLEEELRQAQNYTRGLIESSVDPMITVNQTLTITDVNEQMVRLTEVPKEKLIGSRFDGYFTEPDRAAAGVRQTLREGYVTNYELTLRTPGGREVLVSFNASIFKDTEGNVRGIFAVARDVTEQRRLEQQLREQQNYSRGLIEASVDALMTVDLSGVITDVNEQTVRLSGYNRKQLAGSRFAQYFTDPERAAVGVKKTFEEGVVTNYELVIRSRSGAETVVSFNASVFKDTAGNVAGILAAAREITQQKRIEQELREQQAYNRGLIESNIDALVTIDLVGVITDVNRQMCAIAGRSREELIGTPFKDCFTDRQRAEDGVRKVLAEDRVTNYELTLRAKDGKETVVSYNATTFKGEDGRLKGVFAAARDITAQKRLEEQLREQQVYNRGLIESSVDAMLTVDPDLTITDVNEQMVRLSGYSRDQLVGSAFQDHFSEPERAASGVRKTLSEGFVTNYELTLRSRLRREILVSFNASVFKDAAGKVRGIFAVARDVTEQRRLEEQLRESQHYNRGLIESSVDALVTVDPDVTITDVNEQMIRLTGYTRDELIGSPFKDYFTEPERAAAGVRQTLGAGSVTNYELVLKSKGGKRTVVSFNAGTFRDTEGRIAGILAAARDITAQKRLQEELRDQQNYNRSLIEASVDALMTVDPNGIITDVNGQTARLTGFNRKQLVGSPFGADRARGALVQERPGGAAPSGPCYRGAAARQLREPRRTRKEAAMRSLVLRTLDSLAWVLAAVIAAAPARAQETVPRVDVHGFGSWAYGRTDENVYLAGLPGGNYESTSFALAIASQPSDRLRITGQFELHHGVETAVELDYVFAEWRISDALRLRAGKVKQPFGISAEVVRVGTLRPFLDLPQAVYGPVGLSGEHYDGVGVTGLLPRGRWTVSYDVYGGGLHVEESMGPGDLLRGEPLGSDGVEVVKNVLGGRLVVQTPIDGLSFGVSANRGDEVDSKVRWVVGGHAEYLSDLWSIRSEYAHKDVRDDHIGDAFYLEAARRFGSHWQAVAQYDRFAAELPGVEAPVAPSLLDHEEVAVGLNYWFSRAFVLKLSYHRVDGNRLAGPELDELAAVVASGRLQKRTNLFQFGAQFSF